MIIGIDASKAGIIKRTGVENYVYQLILHLPKNDPNNTYFLYTNKALPAETLADNNTVQKLFPIKRLWNKFFLPLLLIKERADIHIQPLDMIPKTAGKKSIAVVHDLASYKFPDAYSESERELQDSTLREIAQTATKIVCVSESTKNDLIEYFPETKSKISVVYPSYNEEIYHPVERPRDVLNLQEKYFLFVGRIEERKNISYIIKAFRAFKAKSGLKHKLVLAGNEGYGFEKIEREIDKLPVDIKSDLIIPGYIKKEDILDLFARAEAFLYPSLYEGFGIAAIDAMAAGTPVITAKTSSLPEVVGDAAILVDPKEASELTDAMLEISSNPKKRGEMIKNGFNQIKKFSWNNTAKEFIKIMGEM